MNDTEPLLGDPTEEEIWNVLTVQIQNRWTDAERIARSGAANGKPKRAPPWAAAGTRHGPRSRATRDITGSGRPALPPAGASAGGRTTRGTTHGGET